MAYVNELIDDSNETQREILQKMLDSLDDTAIEFMLTFASDYLVNQED